MCSLPRLLAVLPPVMNGKFHIAAGMLPTSSTSWELQNFSAEPGDGVPTETLVINGTTGSVY